MRKSNSVENDSIEDSERYAILENKHKKYFQKYQNNSESYNQLFSQNSNSNSQKNSIIISNDIKMEKNHNPLNKLHRFKFIPKIKNLPPKNLSNEYPMQTNSVNTIHFKLMMTLYYEKMHKYLASHLHSEMKSGKASNLIHFNSKLKNQNSNRIFSPLPKKYLTLIPQKESQPNIKGYSFKKTLRFQDKELKYKKYLLNQDLTNPRYKDPVSRKVIAFQFNKANNEYKDTILTKQGLYEMMKEMIYDDFKNNLVRKMNEFQTRLENLGKYFPNDEKIQLIASESHDIRKMLSKKIFPE